MTRNKRPRKQYRPRPVTAHTLAVACHFAAKPAREDRAQVLAMLDAALASLCAGLATERDWSVAAGSITVAQAIEAGGIVRGLSGHIAAAEAALQNLYDAATRAGPGTWIRPQPTADQAETLRTFAELHRFQVDQLGRAEFLQAIDAAQRQITRAGDTVVLDRKLKLGATA